MQMYKQSRKKTKFIFGLSIVLVIAIALLIVQLLQVDTTVEEVAVLKEEEQVLDLPIQEQRVQLPFSVEAQIAIEYFDGQDHDVVDYTKFEGVYRPSQGMDYTFNNENFDVLCMLDGVVTQAKQDPLFGNTITITSEHVSVTYQSLDTLNYKENDAVKQGTPIAKAASNTYNSQLGNHVHIVVSVNDTIVDPETIYNKTLSQIK